MNEMCVCRLDTYMQVVIIISAQKEAASRGHLILIFPCWVVQTLVSPFSALWIWSIGMTLVPALGGCEESTGL